MLIILLAFQVFTAGLPGIMVVQAGFLDDHKDSLLTVIKGLLMLWILNLMRERMAGNDEDRPFDDNDSDQDDSEGLSFDFGEKDEMFINNEYVTDLEFEMYKMLNKARQEAGLDLLEIDMALTRIARKRAIDPGRYGTVFELLSNEGIGYSLAGENSVRDSTVEKAFYSLMDNPEYKANMLNSAYDRTGIGILERDDGNLMIVQIFINNQEPVE
jgi:hypothetical protein